MRRIILLTTFSLIAYYSLSFPLSISEVDKRGIVRIETPEGKLGTGFILSDSALGFFLVTNKHVVSSSLNQEYFDSVFIRLNKLESGKVIATEDKSTLYLRYKGVRLFQEHKDSNIDLIIIQLGNFGVVSRSKPLRFRHLFSI